MNLPFIKNSQNTGTAIKRALSSLDTVNFAADGGSTSIGKCIRIKFKGSKVDDIDLGFYTMLFIEAEESVYLKKDIIKKLNGLKWEGASFNNKLIDAIVIYSFDENKMRFWFND